jgi:eukaryotic-like serine/threonine-protein kinase
MGTVYEAEDWQRARLVALKVLHKARAQNPESLRRFHIEARVTAGLEHQNLCQVFDVGQTEDGRPYLAMERLRGETLAQRIERDGPLPIRAACDVMVELLSGLAAAHAANVIHRDVKPDNVFLVARRRAADMTSANVKLLDFGISKLHDDMLHLTRTGVVMGTPYYMAPEQARGAEHMDHRIDIYAAGVVLYESLTGRRPFVAANYNALIIEILSARHKPVVELRPDAPPAFDKVLARCLAKRPEDRFASAAELREEIADLKSGLTEIIDAKTQAELMREDEPSGVLARARVEQSGARSVVRAGSAAPEASGARRLDVPPELLDLPSSSGLPVVYDEETSDDDEEATKLYDRKPDPPRR